MVTLERPRTSAEGPNRKKDPLHTEAGDCLIGYLRRAVSGANDQHVLNALLRSDPVAFIEKCFSTLLPASSLQRNWHIEAIAYHLQLCFTGEIRRLIITLPPRSLKSLCTSVAFPAWVLA